MATRLDAARLKRGVVWGSALDHKFLTGRFAQATIELIPDHLLGLGRFFPLYRAPIARYMINDASFTNAAYSFSTGLAEIIPILGIPIVLTDMVILTKNQLFMVYKLGLAFGFSTRWQDYVAEFGSVLGSGFVWRQIARSLVGLIPVWGIAPKTAIAYAGTYVVGNAVGPVLRLPCAEWHVARAGRDRAGAVGGADLRSRDAYAPRQPRGRPVVARWREDVRGRKTTLALGAADFRGRHYRLAHWGLGEFTAA